MCAMEGCPGSRMMDRSSEDSEDVAVGEVKSQLRQWPIQLHLVGPGAPYYQGADVLLVADCVAFAVGDFHSRFLKGKSLAIACPKLDGGQDIYLKKIQALFEEAKINTLTVLIMEVPCCAGLLNMAKQAARASSRKVPLKSVVLSLQGEVLRDEWVTN